MMTIIKVWTIDGTICYKEQVILDILQCITNKEAIKLDLMGEGPCLTEIELYKLLDDICSRFNYPKQSITILTANLLETHPDYRIIKKHQLYELLATQSYVDLVPDSTKIFDLNFKHFGHFIGHSNVYRLQLASYLYSNQKDKILQTYHCCPTDWYHRKHLGIEDLLFNGCSQEEFKWAQQLISNSPITIDTIDSYPILVPANLNITKVYPGFFIELVNLTFFTGKVFYIDEKVWRPILMKTPFMIQGPADTIRNFKKLGFKTFSDWWDEGYSEDPANCQVPSMIENIKRLSQLSLTELQLMYNDMLPTLEHNYNRMMELTGEDFDRVFAL
jgi:hypothetical protein